MQIITLLTAVTAANGAPSIASEAVGTALPFHTDQATLFVRSTAGSGVMTVTVRLWGFNLELDRWFDLGLLNGGVAIGECQADQISYAEGVMGLRGFDRLYAEVTAIAGTATAVSVFAGCVRAEPVTAS